MRLSITLILILCTWMSVFGQWKHIRDVSWGDIQQSTIDSKGDIYLVNSLGDVTKFSKMGELLVEYSAIRRAEVHSVISATQFKTILFYANLQEYVVLNRYLSVPISYKVSDFGVNFASDMAVNYQQYIWFVDMGTFSLKLIDPARNEIIEEKSLAQILDQSTVDIVGFKSNQNKTYLVDKVKGVFVFDTMGNFMFHDSLLSGKDFEFFKDDIYYIDDGELTFYNLYTKKFKRVKLPADSNTWSKNEIWLHGDSVFIIGTSGFKIYKYLSEE